jgi:hypothetical protein
MRIVELLQSIKDGKPADMPVSTKTAARRQARELNFIEIFGTGKAIVCKLTERGNTFLREWHAGNFDDCMKVLNSLKNVDKKTVADAQDNTSSGSTKCSQAISLGSTKRSAADNRQGQNHIPEVEKMVSSPPFDPLVRVREKEIAENTRRQDVIANQRIRGFATMDIKDRLIARGWTLALVSDVIRQEIVASDQLYVTTGQIIEKDVDFFIAKYHKST